MITYYLLGGSKSTCFQRVTNSESIKVDHLHTGKISIRGNKGWRNHKYYLLLVVVASVRNCCLEV